MCIVLWCSLYMYVQHELFQHFPSKSAGSGNILKGTIARDFFTRVLSWIFSIWGPDFLSKRISTIVSYSQSYSSFSRVPRCSLQRRSWIPAVAYNGYFEPRCSLQRRFWIPAVAYSGGRFCRIINYEIIFFSRKYKGNNSTILTIANSGDFESVL